MFFPTNIGFAAFDGGELTGVLIVGSIMMIPIVAILTRHQQRMAEIIQGRGRNLQLEHELEAVRSEVAALRGQVEVQSLQLQALHASGARAGLEESNRLSQRLS